MINTRTRYIVYDHSGTGVRHHHFSVSNSIIGEADGHASPGDTIDALGFPSQIYHGNTVPFAFMSVHGASDGNHLYTDPGAQSVLVGSSDVDILVVYAPSGGIGDGMGGPGVWVDAFNVDIGDFSDDLHFIQVLTPPTPPDTLDNTKTNYANQEGVIGTGSAENMRASYSVDAGAPFLEWKKIFPVESITSNREVDLTTMETGEIWLAFYQTVPPSPGLAARIKDLERAIGSWSDDDYCGTPPHGPGPRPGIYNLVFPEATLKTLNADQRAKLDAVAKQYSDVATKAASEMKNVVSLLRQAGQIIGAQRGK